MFVVTSDGSFGENDGFLYAKEGDVEMWTRIDDGESGVSVRGLARMCGKNHHTLLDLLKKIEQADLVGNRLSKTLKPLAGKPLYWEGFSVKKRGKQIKAVRADVAWSIISHYARKGSEVAHDTLDAIGQIGMTSYLQGKTGWLPQNMQASKDARTQVDRILDNPDPWELMFSMEVIEKIRSWYPPYQEGDFFWGYIYRFLLAEEVAKLNKVNPIDPVTHQRKYRIHQYLEPQTKERLRERVMAVSTLVVTSSSLTDFDRRYKLLYGENVHKERTDNLGLDAA